MSDTGTTPKSPSRVGRAVKTGHVVLPTAGGWAVESGGRAGTSSVHGTQAEAVRAAREAVGATGGALTVRTPDGRDKTTYTIGRDPFRRIGAVEGLAPTAAAEARAERFTRDKLSSEERVRAIIEAHRPADG